MLEEKYQKHPEIKELLNSVEELESNVNLLSQYTLLKKKDKKIKNKSTYTYDTRSIKEKNLSHKKSNKEIEDFFIKHSELEEDEIFFVVKVMVDIENNIQVTGGYHGIEILPFTFLIFTEESDEEVQLAEFSSQEFMLEYMQLHKNSNYNNYIFKIKYKNFKIVNMESIYGGPFDLDFNIINRREGLAITLSKHI